MVARAVIEGVGSYLPARIMRNAELAELVDTSDEWIVERTGIRQRHIAAEDEYTSDLAYHAATAALEDAQVDAQDIDLILLATATPDHTFPATATQVQDRLGIHHGAAFDLQAVCSGFVYGLSTAKAFIESGQAKNVLLIGSETFSRILDWQDRSTCVLFGDGAGAVVLQSRAHEGEDARGVISCNIHSDGRYKDKLYVDGGVSTTKSIGHLRMAGREVFKHAVTNIAQAMRQALDDAGYSANDVDLFVPHQANQRILEAMAKKFNIHPGKIIMTIDKHGNTSAASIPLALDDAQKAGRLKKGDLVLIEAMGGGFTWGATLLRW